MTLHDFGRLQKHWEEVPPLRHLVAGVAASLGVKIEPKSSKPKPMSPEEAWRMFQQTGGKIPGVDGRP